MLRRLALPVALLAGLAAAVPAAHAKQITGLTACGADGCAAVTKAVGQAMHDSGGQAIAGSPKSGPYFRLVMHIGDGKQTFGTTREIYIPSSRTIGGDAGWSLVSDGTAKKLNRALAGRAALPAAGLKAAATAVLAPPEESLPVEIVLPPKPAERGDSSGVTWWLLGAAGLGLAAALALLLRRRRGHLMLAR